MSRMEFLNGGRNAWRLGEITTSPRSRIKAQISERIREAVAVGVWRQGEALPGTGEIARRYGVDPATVRAALRELAEEGVLRVVDKRGYFVRGAASAPTP